MQNVRNEAFVQCNADRLVRVVVVHERGNVPQAGHKHVRLDAGNGALADNGDDCRAVLIDREHLISFL
jgi:hypothetical protein